MIGRAFAVVAAAAVALPAAASADTESVSIQSSAFAPAQTSVLMGDTVEWNNASLRTHTVTARDGSFGSPHIGVGGSFSNQFPNAGTFAYHCQIHPFMTGEVDVYPVLLKGPFQPVGARQEVTLHGRAAAGTSTVEIEADTGSGFAGVATAAVDASGAFHVSVTPTVTARYRAVTAAGTSPEIQVLVMDRKLVVHAARSRRGVLVRVRATPSDPGAIVVLQLQLRERFGWWPTSRRRLDAGSSAVFRARAGARARVELTLPDGWMPVVISPAIRLPRSPK